MIPAAAARTIGRKFKFDLSFIDLATGAALECLAVLCAGRKAAHGVWRSIHEALPSLNFGTYNPYKSKVLVLDDAAPAATLLRLALQKKENMQAKREVRKFLLWDSDSGSKIDDSCLSRHKKSAVTVMIAPAQNRQASCSL